MKFVIDTFCIFIYKLQLRIAFESLKHLLYTSLHILYYRAYHHRGGLNVFMGKSFQDYSWIQDFEADFLWKVSLKIQNLADYNSFSVLLSVYLKKLAIQIWNC